MNFTLDFINGFGYGMLCMIVMIFIICVTVAVCNVNEKQ